MLNKHGLVFISSVIIFLASFVVKADDNNESRIFAYYGLISDDDFIFENKNFPSSDDRFEKQKYIKFDFFSIEQSVMTGKFVHLPLFDNEYYVRFDKVIPGLYGDISYAGFLYGRDFKRLAGNITMTHNAGSVYAYINSPDGSYELVTNDENMNRNHILRKIKMKPYYGKFDINNDALDLSESREEQQYIFPNSMSAITEVRVLVLYTRSLRIKRGGTTPTVNWINTIFSNYNTMLADVVGNDYQLVLATAMEVAPPTFPSIYYENSTHNGTGACEGLNCDSIVADQRWLATNATVASYRNSHSADIVVFLIDADKQNPNDMAHGYAGLKIEESHGYSCGNTSQCGIYATIRDDYAIPNLTFDHEIGHVFGLAHSNAAFTYGYNSFLVEITAGYGKMKPYTIMGSMPPICSFSTIIFEASCHMRLPYYADNSKVRKIAPVGAGFLDYRRFSPHHHVADDLIRGISAASLLK